jgi:translation initiation factor 6
MKVEMLKVLGTPYIGLLALANDKICFVPHGTDQKAARKIEEILGVKAVNVSIYESPLLAVFARMNNKKIFISETAKPREIETIEKEIKVEIVKTENALGNLVALNDFGAIISKTLPGEVAKQFKKSGLNTAHMNVAKAEVVGSSIVATNAGFVMNPNSTKEEVKKVQETLTVKGGFSTANFGDTFVGNSVIANTKGFLAGSLTTGHELNRIEEALGEKK